MNEDPENEHFSANDFSIENLKKLDSSNEIQNEYQKKRLSFTKLLRLTKAFAEIMNFDPPELSEEKLIRFEEKDKTKIVK